MITEIKMPEIGIEEAEVTQILVNVGEKVEVDQSIVVVEGEKASVEIPSLCSGIVESIEVKVGEKVLKDSIILKVKEDDNNYSLKDEIRESTFDSFKNESKKSILTEEKIPPSILEKEEISYKESVNDEHITKYDIYASPGVRKFAREFGVNLDRVKPSGRKGRILQEDVKAYIISMIQKNSYTNEYCTKKKSEFSLNKELDFQQFGNFKIRKLNSLQKIAGNTLCRSWTTVPHVTQFDEIDITELERFRKRQNVEMKKENIDVKITLLTFVIKSVSKGLEKFLHFNSSFIEEKQELILKEYINIGFAIDTKDGLVVAVIRDVNKKSIMELSKEIISLSKKARNRSLFPSDMQGGCFTISSLGSIGGSLFTPIINVPEIAILGVSQSVIKPIWDNDKFVPKLMLPISLSYDHRVINGADGVRFIQYIKKIMSNMQFLTM